MNLYWYLYDVLCDVYYKNGIIHEDEEDYAASYEDLCEQIHKNWSYTDKLEDVEQYGPIIIEIKQTNDPQYLMEEEED